MQVNIRSVVEQDKKLQEFSASDHERVGMASTMLVTVLGNENNIQQGVSREVFARLRTTDTARFHLLCVRIAIDVVTNPKAQIGDGGASYLVPWSSVMETFVRAALYGPQTETSQER